MFYLSDGENWGQDNVKCAEYLSTLQRWCNVIGITEVKPNSRWAEFGRHIENRLTDGTLDPATVITTLVKTHDDILTQLKNLLLVGNGQWLEV